MLITYRDKVPHHLCVRARACVRVSVSVNMESTTYRIHLTLQNAKHLRI